MSGPAARLIEAALAAANDMQGSARGRAVAVGWATVELERAVTELAADLGVPAAAFLAADDSAGLGAWCRVAPGLLSGGCALAVIEPATEGRLAEILARRGEGPWVVWIESADGTGAVGPPRPGPFGPERPVAGRPADGLYRLLVPASPGTIRP